MFDSKRLWTNLPLDSRAQNPLLFVSINLKESSKSKRKIVYTPSCDWPRGLMDKASDFGSED